MKYLVICLPISAVKRAIYKQDANYFREALLLRLAEGATQERHLNWRCVGGEQDILADTVALVFEEAPDSHSETIMAHNINRLLEKGDEKV